MTKFLVDRMLGQTAKWLRLLGVDAEYAPEGEDERLLEIAEEEERIIVTRDKELGNKENSFLVENTSPETIVEQIIERYSIEIEPFSRCSKCNTPVESVEKEEVNGEVPEKVFQRQDRFWHCPRCDQYYWKGTHWDKIKGKIEQITGESN